jgi:hypothetical protein
MGVGLDFEGESGKGFFGDEFSDFFGAGFGVNTFNFFDIDG